MKNNKVFIIISIIIISITIVFIYPSISKYHLFLFWKEIIEKTNIFLNIFVCVVLLYNFFRLKQKYLYIILVFCTVLLNKLYLNENIIQYHNYIIYIIPYFFVLLLRLFNKGSNNEIINNPETTVTKDSTEKIIPERAEENLTEKIVSKGVEGDSSELPSKKITDKKSFSTSTDNDRVINNITKYISIPILILFFIIIGVLIYIFFFTNNSIMMTLSKNSFILYDYILIVFVFFGTMLIGSIFIYFLILLSKELWVQIRSAVLTIKSTETGSSESNISSMVVYFLIAIIYIFIWSNLSEDQINFMKDILSNDGFIVVPLAILFSILFMIIFKSTIDYILQNTENVKKNAEKIYDKLSETFMSTFYGLFEFSDIFPNFISSFNSLLNESDDINKENSKNIEAETISSLEEHEDSILESKPSHSIKDESKLIKIKKSIQIYKTAALALAIVSWLTTAEGLKNFVFSGDSFASYSISFAIQSSLFLLSLNTNARKVDKNHSVKEYKFIFLKCSTILFYLCIITSSFFSFVFFSKTIYDATKLIDSEIVIMETCNEELVNLRTFEVYIYDELSDQINIVLTKLDNMYNSTDNSIDLAEISDFEKLLTREKNSIVNSKLFSDNIKIALTDFIDFEILSILAGDSIQINKASTIYNIINDYNKNKRIETLNNQINTLKEINNGKQELLNSRVDESKREPVNSSRTKIGGDIYNAIEELKSIIKNNDSKIDEKFNQVSYIDEIDKWCSKIKLTNEFMKLNFENTSTSLETINSLRKSLLLEDESQTIIDINETIALIEKIYSKNNSTITFDEFSSFKRSGKALISLFEVTEKTKKFSESYFTSDSNKKLNMINESNTNEWKDMISQLRNIINELTILNNEVKITNYEYRKSIIKLYDLERYHLTTINELERTVKRFFMPNGFLSVIALIIAVLIDFLSLLIGYNIEKLNSSKIINSSEMHSTDSSALPM